MAEATLVDSRRHSYTSISTEYGSRLQPSPVVEPDINHGLHLRPRQTTTGYNVGNRVVPASMQLRQLQYMLSGGWKTPPGPSGGGRYRDFRTADAVSLNGCRDAASSLRPAAVRAGT